MPNIKLLQTTQRQQKLLYEYSGSRKFAIALLGAILPSKPVMAPSVAAIDRPKAHQGADLELRIG